jgi:hypothetical protein
VYALAGAVVILLPRLLPYLYALYMQHKNKPFTVEDHGVKITSDGPATGLRPSSLSSDNGATSHDDGSVTSS